ncbi:hypothetical protein Dimus_030164 [Dionaea muscipula]
MSRPGVLQALRPAVGLENRGIKPFPAVAGVGQGGAVQDKKGKGGANEWQEVRRKPYNKPTVRGSGLAVTQATGEDVLVLSDPLLQHSGGGMVRG